LVRKEHVVAVVLVSVGVAAGFYYFYSPPPKIPNLSGSATRAIVRVGDLDRNYLAYVPARLARGAPLVLVLHGSFMNGQMMREGTGYEFDVLADRNGFAVVYPDGYESNWNDCRRTAAYPAKRLNIDDMGFVRAIIARFVSDLDIDPSRVFAAGYSDSAEMVHRLALEAPKEIAAVAAIEGNLPAASDTICNGDGRPSRAVIIGGTDDPLVPFNGGEITLFGLTPGRGLVRSAPETAQYYVTAHGIDTPPQTVRLPHKYAWDPTSVEQSIWSREGSPVVAFYRIGGGGHVVPQPVYRWPRFLGRQTEDLNAPVAIWDFFAAANGRN
jgi:polyhydroxybutyrate depolymerase